MMSIDWRSERWKPLFFTIWGGQAFSLLGSRLVQFALVWQLTITTGSATILAMATLVALLPEIVLMPFTGALVDRWNRRLVMILADSSIALVTLVLVLLTASGLLQIWQIYAALVLRAIGGVFHYPAMQASTSLMVPERQLSRVAGLNQTLYGAMSILAPPMGALLLAIWPLWAVLLVDIVTAVIAIFPLLWIRIPQPLRAAAQEKASGYWKDLADGFRYIWHWPGLLTVLLMAALINFLISPAFALIPLLVTKHFRMGVLELGAIEAAVGIGTLLGGLTLSIWGGFKRRILTTLVGLVGMGVGIFLVGAAPASLFWLALAGMFVVGITSSLVNGPIMAVLQSVVAPEMQGRVLSVSGALASAMMPLSLAVAGPLSDALGIQLWFLVGGVACTLMGIIGFFLRAVTHLEDRKASPPAMTETHDKSILSP
jgi:DHA3 family macrolide efflux protein-like MFS transporter